MYNTVRSIEGVTMKTFKQFIAEKQFYADDKREWDVDRVWSIVVRNFRVQKIPLEWLVDSTGHLSGDSNEPDETEEFFDQVRGLDLRAYRRGKYPPILVLKEHNDDGEYSVADGRHRTVNLLYLLRNAGIPYQSQTINGYVVDMEDPRNVDLFRAAEAKESEYWTED